MASFIVKQLVGKQLDSVKGAVGGGGDDKKETNAEGEEAELAAQRLEEEEKRREKHRKSEAERETMRQQIRDKYGIKKKSAMAEVEDPNRSGQIGRKRKTPQQLAAEAKGEGGEEGNGGGGFLPANVSDVTSKLTEAPGQLVGQVTEKCLLM